MLKFNSRKCNSGSSFSGCVHCDKSKYPTASKTFFERTLLGGFSSVNTRRAVDSQTLMPKNERDNLKLIYNFKQR